MTTTRRRARARDDEGLVSSAVLVCAIVLAAAILLAVTLPLVAASEQKSRSQIAADAAALAGAEGARELALGRVDEAVWHGGSLLAGAGAAGQAEAADYADRNGGRVMSYAYHGGSDRVEVVVELVEGEPGDRSRSRGYAGVGVALGACERTHKTIIVDWTEPPPPPPPPPTPTPEPTPSPTPTPTPTFEPQPIWGSVYGFRCTGDEAFEVPAEYTVLQLGQLEAIVREKLESATKTVRLTG